MLLKPECVSGSLESWRSPGISIPPQGILVREAWGELGTCMINQQEVLLAHACSHCKLGNRGGGGVGHASHQVRGWNVPLPEPTPQKVLQGLSETHQHSTMYPRCFKSQRAQGPLRGVSPGSLVKSTNSLHFNSSTDRRKYPHIM